MKDARDRVGAWFGALTVIVGGAFLLWGPSDIVEEVPYAETIGGVSLAFGFLVVLAVTLRGSAGYRARSLLICCTAVLVAGGLGWWSWDAAQDVWALHERGEVRSVPVVGTTTRQNPKTRKIIRLTQVAIDGRRVSLDLGHLPRRGTVVEVLVAEDRPKAAVSSATPREWLPLIDAVVGRWIALLILGLLLACIVAAPFSLWNAIIGPRSPAP